MNKGNLTFDQALKKLQRYCAYQDRCHREVRTKLLSLGVRGMELEEIMTTLIQENFLNEERFARSYARGKFRIKKWGRVRISRELKLRQISAYCLKAGLSEIDDESYRKTLTNLLQDQWEKHPDLPRIKRRQKAFQMAHRKGFETSLINELLNYMLNTHDDL